MSALKKAGANVNLKNNEGKTAAMIVAENQENDDSRDRIVDYWKITLLFFWNFEKNGNYGESRGWNWTSVVVVKSLMRLQ